MSRAEGHSRPLLLYARSRHVAAALSAALGTTALLWALAAALDQPAAARPLGMAAVVAGVAVAGSGLAGADVDLDRAAALEWRSRRAAHAALVTVGAFGIVAATALSGHQLGPVGEMARNAVGAGGLLALAAATFGAGRAWIPPVVWVLAAPRILFQLWPAAEPPAYAEALTWPAQPAASNPALITALVLGVVGTATYAIAGPRP